LFISSDKSEARLIRQSLDDAGDPFQTDFAFTAESMTRHLAARSPNLIVSELRVQGQYVEPLLRDHPSVPVLLLVPAEDVEQARKAVDRWALDYEIKSGAILSDMQHVIERRFGPFNIPNSKDLKTRYEKQLAERDMLVKEIHHRVKNNFQTVCGVLSLQSQYIEDKRLLNMLTECQDRIRAMALLHEKFYRSNDMIKIDFRDYIENLVKGLFWSFGTDPKRVKLEIHVDDVELEIDRSVPCSLIINELVSNTLKHAFPSDWKGIGHIGISVRKHKEGIIELLVEDNGVGIPEHLDIKRSDSFGLELVTIMARDQLNGRIELDRNDGTRIRVFFQEKRVPLPMRHDS